MCGLISSVYPKMTLEVDRIAQEAFRTQNYEVAVQCFNELLSEHGPKTDWLLGKADALARSGRINDAFSVYAHAFRLGEVREEQLQHLVVSLIERTSNRDESTVQMKSSDNNSTVQSIPRFGMFTCHVCNSLLQEPATITCGHTFCKPCIPSQLLRTCPACKTKHSLTGPTAGIRCDVLLSSLLKQYFPKEVQAHELRKEGNRHFKAGQYQEALSKYIQAKHLGESLCKCVDVEMQSTMLLYNASTCGGIGADKIDLVYIPTGMCNMVTYCLVLAQRSGEPGANAVAQYAIINS